MDVSTGRVTAEDAALPVTGADGRRVYIETYGCQMNVSDTELMQGILGQAGYGRAATAEDADIILVNTCAIRENAEQRVWGRLSQLGRLKRTNPSVILGVTGCMAKHVGARLTGGAAQVDVLAGPDAYRSLPRLIAVGDDRRCEQGRRTHARNGPADRCGSLAQ